MSKFCTRCLAPEHKGHCQEDDLDEARQLEWDMWNE